MEKTKLCDVIVLSYEIYFCLTMLLQRLASLGAICFWEGMIVSIELYCTWFCQNPPIHTGTRVWSGTAVFSTARQRFNDPRVTPVTGWIRSTTSLQTADLKGAINLSHWADRQAKGLFAHPRSNVISWLALFCRLKSAKYETNHFSIVFYR